MIAIPARNLGFFDVGQLLAKGPVTFHRDGTPDRAIGLVQLLP